jgi:hypothetical protein
VGNLVAANVIFTSASIHLNWTFHLQDSRASIESPLTVEETRLRRPYSKASDRTSFKQLVYSSLHLSALVLGIGFLLLLCSRGGVCGRLVHGIKLTPLHGPSSI